jgi:hypothetical protein
MLCDLCGSQVDPAQWNLPPGSIRDVCAAPAAVERLRTLFASRVSWGVLSATHTVRAHWLPTLGRHVSFGPHPHASSDTWVCPASEAFLVYEPSRNITEDAWATAADSGSSRGSSSGSSGNMTLVDVGGRRLQRKKWSHILFDPDIRVIVFVMSLCDYAVPALEQPTRDRLHEAFQLFQQTFGAESPLHGATHFRVVVVLTHRDTFLRKHRAVPFHLTVTTSPDISLLPDEMHTFSGRDDAAMLALLPRVYARWLHAKTGKSVQCYTVDATLAADTVALFELIRTDKIQ